MREWESLHCKLYRLRFTIKWWDIRLACAAIVLLFWFALNRDWCYTNVMRKNLSWSCKKLTPVNFHFGSMAVNLICFWCQLDRSVDRWINHPHLPPGNLCGLDGRNGTRLVLPSNKEILSLLLFLHLSVEPQLLHRGNQPTASPKISLSLAAWWWIDDGDGDGNDNDDNDDRDLKSLSQT